MRIFGRLFEILQFLEFSGISGIFPRYREFIQIFHFSLFPIFSLLSQTRVSPTGFIIKCSDPLHTAFNAYGQVQLRSNHHVFLSFPYIFLSGRSYNLRVPLLAQTRASFEWRRKSPFLRFFDLNGGQDGNNNTLPLYI